MQHFSLLLRDGKNLLCHRHLETATPPRMVYGGDSDQEPGGTGSDGGSGMIGRPVGTGGAGGSRGPRRATSELGAAIVGGASAYTVCRRKIEMSPGAQSRDDTPAGGGHDQRDTGS
jgi:hypothetical protein